MALNLVSNCDATTDWEASEGGDVSNDTSDKMEGTGSLKNTVASPSSSTLYQVKYAPAGTWDWSNKKHLLFWLKSDRVSGDFSYTKIRIFEGSNWRYWDLTFEADTWTAFKLLLSTGDEESGPPDLTLIDQVPIQFEAADETAFYVKVDHMRVIGGEQGGNLSMTMDMKL